MISDDEMAFLRSIKDNPEENTNRLVYADWLDENEPAERQKMGFAIREYIHFQQVEAHGVIGAYDRHATYTRTVVSNKGRWYGQDMLNWEAAGKNRHIFFVAGMLSVKGKPCGLNKIPLDAAPWVLKLVVVGPDGGVGGIITAMERTEAVELQFATQYAGTRSVLERYARSVRKRHERAHSLRYLNLGVVPTPETLDHMVNWDPALINKMVKVKATNARAIRHGEHAYALYKAAVKRLRRRWADVSGRDIVEIPEDEV
jgi:uncharacterized protein (TIGR02996 family)